DFPVTKKSPLQFGTGFFPTTRTARTTKRCRRRPTLPRPLGRSTIGAVGLNDRVRNGNGCGPYALVASDVDADEPDVGTRSRIRQRTGCEAGPRMRLTKRRERWCAKWIAGKFGVPCCDRVSARS